MRILFLTHAFNSLAQRLYVELAARGHEVSIEIDVNDRVTEEAARLFDPELVVAPFLKRAIPESVWRNRRCIVIHPGIVGDRGPSSLDWAVQDGAKEWGVTALEAVAEMDAGPVWASVGFPMRPAAKGSLYRNEVAEAAVKAMLATLGRMQNPSFRPQPLDDSRPEVRGRLRPLMRQADRAIDWLRDGAATVLAKIHAADGVPGVLDEIRGVPVYLHDAHPEDAVRGARPGDVIARRDGAILRATVDGAVWIGHLRRKIDGEPTLKLPATMVLAEQLEGVSEAPATLWDESAARSYRELRYEEADGVGYVYFEFYNGAMSTRQCERLAEAIRFAKSRPTRVIALMGGPDFWSNGIHLGVIEASPTPADESWANINAIDDVAREILTCDRHLTVAAMRGNAGAGGVFLALAADRVLARRGVVLNPHYKGMGNLYGSEYWTYLLPRRVGLARAAEITGNRLPIGAPQAAALGLIDEAVGDDVPGFVAHAVAAAQRLGHDPGYDSLLARKRATRAADEAAKPLATYRAEELERMKLNFYGFDPSYHVARYHFVFKVPKSRTPLYLAKHRAGARPARATA
ncbi:MAG TPA: hydrogenase maturation protein [Burkholderiales bacterium]|nr:hydrogenase maturation protein [Burkholderiales bacterium]